MSSMENQKRRSIVLVFVSCILMAGVQAAENTTRIPVNVGVIADLDEPAGKMYLSCIEMALSDFYASHAQYKTRVVLSASNSHEDVVGAADAALDLIKNVEVKAILGPMTSMQATFVVNLGEKAHVPIISFSATSSSLTSLQSSFFFQLAQNDSSQVKAISGVIQNFAWRRVVPIYVDNLYGEGIIPFLIDALLEVNAHVPYRSLISQSATDDEIKIELYKLMTMQTRVFIVHMMPKLASKLFSKAKEIGMMNKGFVWITTNGIGDHLRAMGSVLNSMQGVLSVETNVLDTSKLREFRPRWKRQFQKDNPEIIDVELDVFGYRAYDAAFAIAMAIENVGNASFGFENGNISAFNSTDIGNLKISQYGSNISNALSLTSFRGISGDFNLVDRQLQLSTFKIVNVNGYGARVVGYWTPENGRLVNNLNTTSSCNVSAVKCDALGPIIWPGESSSVPKGWEIPENGTKLRIGVPVKDGFTEFVKVTTDLSTNTTDVNGFSIDVFKAVVDKLPYALPYELIPFAYPNGTSAGTYNDLIYQIYLGKFDAVVGDATIRANRTLYVDFAMPYTESGVVMVVPIIDSRIKNAWVFLQPLTWDLWMTTLCFFIFIGFVIWVLEHRINEDFRGPPSHQVGTSFWFSFSTMVFSHRERVVSNLGRFVMIIWVFVVLIVTQSYTANLASLLTVQQLRPTVNDLDDLLRNGENVGYMRGAYVYGLLIQRGFQDSKLKPYGYMEEIDEALLKGSRKGGIAAIVHETPYMKLFVAKYCSKYTMIGPIFKTDGFGFAFPKGSPLVSDITQAVLNLTDDGMLSKIEDKWIKKDSNCKDSTGKYSSSALSLESFWGLFLIAGTSSIFALIIFITSFLHEHKHVLMPPDSDTSVWKRIRAMFEIFNQNKISSHTFKSSRHSDSSVGAHDHEGKSLPPNNNWPESPQSYTNHTEATSAFSGQETPISHGLASPEIFPSYEHAITIHETSETT
ncbi:glutamate receptor 2.8-like [Argentina anserina]|uniref:glutamate receptor 2.8-like n=1 Tax=Argentina anserina TaxID=57926 RepID=UPI00217620D8|nr:glutamate receptor 2.8-like [Potentilla anserina]